MKIEHLRYFIALSKRGNYRETAEFCHVSQPAISMAIKSFEEKLDKKLFVRASTPVKLSPFGEKLLPYAEAIVHQFDEMMHLSLEKADMQRPLRLGIIPTISPYLIPVFLGDFLDKNPKGSLEIEDLTTAEIIDRINKDELDAGIIATPVEGMKLEHQPMYYEEFFAYTNAPLHKHYILPGDIDLEKLWLLKEGHCFRNQIINLCELQNSPDSRVAYNAGSIETLINLVNTYGGITVLPELSTKSFSRKEKDKLQVFQAPAPVREVSLAYHKYTICQDTIESLGKTIIRNIPAYMREKQDYLNVPIGEVG